MYQRDSKRIDGDTLCSFCRLLLPSFSNNKAGREICAACEKGNVTKAERFLDLVVNVRLKRDLRDLVRFCYQYRDLSINEIKVVRHVAQKLSPIAEVEKWIKQYAPYEARPPLIMHVNDAVLARMIVLNRKISPRQGTILPTLSDIEDFERENGIRWLAHALGPMYLYLKLRGKKDLTYENIKEAAREAYEMEIPEDILRNEYIKGLVQCGFLIEKRDLRRVTYDAPAKQQAARAPSRKSSSHYSGQSRSHRRS